MPEIINNVTTGSGLLHEVFQETIKQSLVSSGFHVYEYDQSSGRFKSVVDGSDIGVDVVFARRLDAGGSRYGTENQNSNQITSGNMIVDLSDGNILPYAISDDDYIAYYRIAVLNSTTGLPQSLISTSRSYYESSNNRAAWGSSFLVFNPVPGRVIYYMINTQVDNVDTRYFYEGVVLYSYNTSNLTMTERSALRPAQFVGDRPDNTGWDQLTVGGLSRTRPNFYPGVKSL